MDYERATLPEMRQELLAGEYKGMPIAGLLYWAVWAVILLLFPEPQNIVYLAWTCGLIFPLGVLVTKLRGGDMFKDAKDSPLTSAFMMALITCLLFFPLVMVAATFDPLLFIVGLSLISGNIWIMWGWTAGTNLGLYHSLGRAVGSYAAYFFVPQPYTASAICAVVVAAYLYSFWRMRSLPQPSAS
ncbi:MAG: hypothetical protein ABJF89_01735 [Parasphingorhabdus sp.]|uniref:DUF7010 family protein n=1 Tax=Parasphingorhabdus sp. TaxID=2709688 RepID=UPI00326548FD